MQINKRMVLIMILILAVGFLSACDSQAIAESIPRKAFRQWFYEQLWWITIGTIILGIVVSIIIRRFDVKAPATHTNRLARFVFAAVLGFILLAIPLVLWTQAYLSQPFGRPLLWTDYFPLIVKDTYTILIMIFSVIVFYLVVMLSTRVIFGIIGISCDCKYAFLPKFKRANK